MTDNTFWIVLALSYWLSLLTIPTATADEQNNKRSEQDIPDRQLLEFIADFGIINDEIFDLIIHHGKDDLGKTDETSTTPQEPDHDY